MDEAEVGRRLDQAASSARAGEVDAAIAAHAAVLAARPELTDIWYEQGRLLRRARRFEAALDAYAQALDRGVRGPEEVHLNRAVILSDDLRRPDAAEAELTAALALNPRYVPAWLNLGNLHEDRGRKDQAAAAYEQALAHSPGDALALSRLGGLSRAEGGDDPLIARLRAALAAVRGVTREAMLDRADLGFALGRRLDEAGLYDEAFAAFAAANTASRAMLPAAQAYDRAEAERRVEAIIAAWPEAPATTGDGADDGAPVFICGLFRSGSTLIEQILAAHPRVTAGGELDLIPELAAELEGAAPSPGQIAAMRAAYLEGARLRFPEADILTDKRPDNIAHIGLIKAMFPHARIVRTVREATDNALSIHFLHLSHAMPWALDLEDTAHWLGLERRLAAHWRALWPDDWHEVDYDALVADPEPALRGLTAFLGLDWTPTLLDFHRADNAVRTASVWQVREPLYRRSSGRWRNYERHLGPVRAALAAALPPDERPE